MPTGAICPGRQPCSAHPAAHLKHRLEATAELGGENYVFWGGREGYETLLNTKYAQEQNQFAALLHLAVDHAKKIGFKGQFLIEPKPREPSKHQYDFDTATVLSFLRAHGLYEHFKINVEANHATLAGHTFAHELTVAAAENKLGSIDANAGDILLGWDTDQFPINLYDTATAMIAVLQQKGGIGSAGFNFDAKGRRGSNDVIDLCYDHIGGTVVFPVSGEPVPAFPNARYILQRADRDWQFQLAESDEEDRVIADLLLKPLEQADVVDLIDGDHRLADGIELHHAPGHTPGHQVVRLRSGSARALLSADAFNHPIQLDHPEWPSGPDASHEGAETARRALLAEHGPESNTIGAPPPFAPRGGGERKRRDAAAARRPRGRSGR